MRTALSRLAFALCCIATASTAQVTGPTPLPPGAPETSSPLATPPAEAAPTPEPDEDVATDGLEFGEAFPMSDVYAFTMTVTLDRTRCAPKSEQVYECRIDNLTFDNLLEFEPGSKSVEPLVALPQALSAEPASSGTEVKVAVLAATEFVLHVSRPGAPAGGWMDDKFSRKVSYLILARLVK